MPVKVRCPGCRKVLTAPDAARGKALKCPDCETKVRIPEGDEESSSSSKSAPKEKPKSKATREESDISQIDISNAEDERYQLCPKCGADIPDGANECPKCGVDPSTGQLTKSAKRKKSLKGVDPQEFYKVVWKDCFRFANENFLVVIRTLIYFVVASSISQGCTYMGQIYCKTLPPRVFWLALATLANLTIPGWVWHLNVETVKITTVRKTSLADIKFDMFTAFALGVKYVVWYLSHIWTIIGVFALPMSLIHFSMPVEYRGWVVFTTVRLMFQHIGAVAIYWLMRLLWVLAWSIAPIIVAISFYAQLNRLSESHDLEDLNTIAKVSILVVWVVWLFFIAYSEVALARVVGLMAYYFRDTLDLQMIVAEKAYVKKVVRVDKYGNKIQSPMAKYGPIVFVIISLILVSNVITYFWTEGRHVAMPDSWARAMNLIE